MLGATTSREGEMTVSTIPGSRLFFTEGSAVPTKGVECEMLFGGAAP